MLLSPPGEKGLLFLGEIGYILNLSRKIARTINILIKSSLSCPPPQELFCEAKGEP
jgi:hypothetical protein